MAFCVVKSCVTKHAITVANTDTAETDFWRWCDTNVSEHEGKRNGNRSVNFVKYTVILNLNFQSGDHSSLVLLFTVVPCVVDL